MVPFCNNLKCAIPIRTKIGRNILFDPRNKLTEFLTYHKIQDGRCGCHYDKLRKWALLKSIQVRDPFFS